MKAPEDIPDDAMQDDRYDHLLETGMSIARNIQRRAVEHGRLRHDCEETALSPTQKATTKAAPRDTTTSDPNADTVSVTDRRRSV